MTRRRAITAHHVRALRARMALIGTNPRELARRVGVSDRTLYDIVNTRQSYSRYLEPILEAVGLDPGASSDALALHADVIDALCAAGRADLPTLRAALAVLTNADAGAPAETPERGPGR
jgi:hypothetical protein